MTATTRFRTAGTALLLALLAAACDTPTDTPSGRPGQPSQPQQPAEKPVASITVTPDTLTLLSAGGYRKLEVSLRAADGTQLSGRTVTWSSSNLQVAHVNADGYVSAIEPGVTIITAASEGKTAEARVQVHPVVPATIHPEAAVIDLDHRQWRSIGATVRSADGRVLYDFPVRLQSSDSLTVGIDPAGRAYGRRGGSAVLTLTSGTATAQVEVRVARQVTYDLVTVDGRALPAVVDTSSYVRESDGAVVRVWARAEGGSVKLSTVDQGYEHHVLLRTYEQALDPVFHEPIGPVRLVGERTVSDRGERAYPESGIGEMFASNVRAGLRYYAWHGDRDVSTQVAGWLPAEHIYRFVRR